MAVNSNTAPVVSAQDPNALTVLLGTLLGQRIDQVVLQTAGGGSVTFKNPIDVQIRIMASMLNVSHRITTIRVPAFYGVTIAGLDDYKLTSVYKDLMYNPHLPEYASRYLTPEAIAEWLVAQYTKHPGRVSRVIKDENFIKLLHTLFTAIRKLDPHYLDSIGLVYSLQAYANAAETAILEHLRDLLNQRFPVMLNIFDVLYATTSLAKGKIPIVLTTRLVPPETLNNVRVFLHAVGAIRRYGVGRVRSYPPILSSVPHYTVMRRGGILKDVYRRWGTIRQNARRRHNDELVPYSRKKLPFYNFIMRTVYHFWKEELNGAITELTLSYDELRTALSEFFDRKLDEYEQIMRSTADAYIEEENQEEGSND